MWVLGALFSAILLGIYDIFKKLSLNNNAVLPVLFFSTLTSACLFTPFILLSRFNPNAIDHYWYIAPQTAVAHIHFIIKSIIVGSSWVLAYFSMKHLPITIFSPIRSSGPLWTLLGAILIFGEKMTLLQWSGLVTTISFYYVFSLYGKKEGISFRTNKWVLFMVLSTIIGSISSLYDKYLIAHYDRMAMQSWFSIYMVPIMSILMFLVWYPNRAKYTPFQWRYTILLIGLTLTIADFIYFRAISQEGSLISIISTVRRGSVIVSFTVGAILFREKNIKIKALILAGILAGIGLIILGS
jgi:bacterial/archaeal transporter family protein